MAENTRRKAPSGRPRGRSGAGGDGGGATLRSAEWFGHRDLEGFLHRSGLKAQGWPESAFTGKPVIGIANSWSEATHCNAHLRDLAAHVKRGIKDDSQAGDRVWLASHAGLLEKAWRGNGLKGADQHLKRLEMYRRG